MIRAETFRKMSVQAVEDKKKALQERAEKIKSWVADVCLETLENFEAHAKSAASRGEWSVRVWSSKDFDQYFNTNFAFQSEAENREVADTILTALKKDLVMGGYLIKETTQTAWGKPYSSLDASWGP